MKEIRIDDVICDADLIDFLRQRCHAISGVHPISGSLGWIKVCSGLLDEIDRLWMELRKARDRIWELAPSPADWRVYCDRKAVWKAETDRLCGQERTTLTDAEEVERRRLHEEFERTLPELAAEWAADEKGSEG